jgi:hypothetical protein
MRLPGAGAEPQRARGRQQRAAGQRAAARGPGHLHPAARCQVRVEGHVSGPYHCLLSVTIIIRYGSGMGNPAAARCQVRMEFGVSGHNYYFLKP